MNLVPNETAPALEKGDLMHKMLEKFYNTPKVSSDNEFSKIILDIMNFGRHYAGTSGNLDIKDIELVTRVFRDYAMNYRFENMNVEAVELPFAKILYEDTDIRIIIEGTYDILGSNPQTSYVMDHKTKSSDTAPVRLNNQFQCYAWASERRILIVNSILLKVGESDEKRFKRQVFDYPPELIKEWVEATTYYAIELSKLADRNYYPPDFTSCKLYGMCQYYKICEQPPNLRMIEVEQNYHVEEAYDKNRFELKKEGE
jgi:hypothetical protein